MTSSANTSTLPRHESNPSSSKKCASALPIASRYAEMRSRQDERTFIRLVSAHAKARLSPIVEAEADVKAAMDILSFALYHDNNGIGSDGNGDSASDMDMNMDMDMDVDMTKDNDHQNECTMQ